VAEEMKNKGFEDVRVLRGGWHEWQRAEYPVELK